MNSLFISMCKLTLNQLVRGSSPRPGTNFKSLQVKFLQAFSCRYVPLPRTVNQAYFRYNSPHFMGFLSKICQRFFAIPPPSQKIFKLQKQPQSKQTFRFKQETCTLLICSPKQVTLMRPSFMPPLAI